MHFKYFVVDMFEQRCPMYCCPMYFMNSQCVMCYSGKKYEENFVTLAEMAITTN